MRRCAVTALLGFLICSVCPGAVEAGVPAPDASPTPEGLVTRIYDEVSRTACASPDWAAVRSRFHPQAVVVLRVSKDETRLMSVDEFLGDFQAFYDRIGPEAEFTEKVISARTTAYGNVAHVFVVYEAAVRGSDRFPQRGLDSWQLMFQEGRWWIVSVVNDSEGAAGPLPRGLLDE
jgi:hypothetical protein